MYDKMHIMTQQQGRCTIASNSLHLHNYSKAGVSN